MKLIWPVFVMLLGLLTHTVAQISTTQREVKGKSGQDIRVGVFANVLPDCTSGPLPTIRLIQPPVNGKITVRKGRLNATNFKQCLALEVPALIAIYRSAADFEGIDSAIIEVRSSKPATQLQRITVRVSKAGVGQNI